MSKILIPFLAFFNVRHPKYSDIQIDTIAIIVDNQLEPASIVAINRDRMDPIEYYEIFKQLAS